jgi:hypothetical protein
MEAREVSLGLVRKGKNDEHVAQLTAHSRGKNYHVGENARTTRQVMMSEI